MDTRADSHRKEFAQAKSRYLVGYNLVCAFLWTIILGRTLLLVPLIGFENVYGGVGTFTKWTQSIAILEIVHSATGLVRSPILTTSMQVASRLLLVWGVLFFHPASTQTSIFVTSMYIAWSVTEVIRYSYFVMNLQSTGVPQILSWLRYNTFYVLYPTGILSECALIWKASVDPQTGRPWSLAFWAILAVYVPGSYILFTHMMTQRRKVMRGKGRQK